MSVQLGWFVTGFLVMLLLHSGYLQLGDEKTRSSATIQFILAAAIALLAAGRIANTWP